MFDTHSSGRNGYASQKITSAVAIQKTGAAVAAVGTDLCKLLERFSHADGVETSPPSAQGMALVTVFAVDGPAVNIGFAVHDLVQR
jgi:hypothetical protein